MRNGPKLNMDQKESLNALVTDAEIWKSLKGMNDLSAPGIDGFNAKFLKSYWDIIKEDIIKTAKHFFEKNKLYKAANCTLVTLVPKFTATTLIKDYIPISCCTVFYKVISKIKASRLGKVLPSIVHSSQAAFVPGKKIHGHILMAYELIRGYSMRSGAPKCFIQIDLQKAYDTVERNTLESIMKELNFPQKFIG
ncbi:unnamed protein product [Lathyrus sativus]|nr:unnamed protein product [Lathyrus sativus]